ncbi:hypothetical protein KR067_003542, partial [Drosophila pandora]
MALSEAPTNISDLLCRVCLKTHDVSIRLNYKIELNQITLRIWQLLESICKARCPWMEPTLPNQLCQNCTQRLVNAYEFIQEVESAQRTLQKRVISNQDQSTDVNSKEAGVDVVQIVEQGNVIDPDEIVTEATIKDHHEASHLEGIGEGLETTKSILLVENVSVTFEDNNVASEEVEDLETSTSETEDDAHFASDGEVIDTGVFHGEVNNLQNQSKEHVDNQQLNITRPSMLGSRLAQSQNFNYKCGMCPRTFAKKESLARHFALAHTQAADSAAQKLASEEANEITCRHCPRSFKRHYTLRRHMEAFHPEASDIPRSPVKKRVTKRRDCPYCGVSFPASSIAVHIRRHTGENPYKCTECEKAFPRSQDLNLHMRQHTGERPSECRICFKKFISPNKLSRHMRLHTGQRPYVCSICQKAFVQSNDLKIHMRRHTGERPYQCGVCGDSFICGAFLNIHRNDKGHQEAAGSDSDRHGKTFASKRGAEDLVRMRSERAEEHLLKSSTSLTERPEFFYKCAVCKASFKNGALLTKHRNNMKHYEMGR